MQLVTWPRFVLALAAAAAVAACGTSPGTGGPDGTPGSMIDSAPGAPDAHGKSAIDAAPGRPDASSSLDGTPTRQNCTSNWGNALTQTHGRIDGYLVSIVPQGTSSCNGDRDHLHLQIKMNGGIYDVAINIYDTYNTPINHEIYFAEEDTSLPDGAWSEGWHPGDDLDYASLGLHSSGSQFSAMTETQLRTKITGELNTVNHISIFMTGYGSTGGHDVHRKGSGNDGAIFLQPLSSKAHALFFHFYNQTF